MIQDDIYSRKGRVPACGEDRQNQQTAVCYVKEQVFTSRAHHMSGQ